MKYQNLFLVVLLISLVSLADINDKTRPQQRRPDPTRPVGTKVERGKNVEFDLCYDFATQAVASKIKFVTVIPKTIPDRQKILNISYSTEPSRIFEENGNSYAEFIFSKPANQFQLKINVKAVLFRYDLVTARRKYKENPPVAPELDDFLKHEPYIEKDDPLIQQIAKSITGRTEQALLRNIYEYVTDNLKYVIQSEEPGAVKTLRKKQGGCTEYSDLFVALCRARNIPARVVKGYVTESDDSPQHAWAEVYLQKYGWVPFDPTYGDVIEKSVKNKRFQNLKPIYIYLTNIRNDPILDKSITVEGLWVGEIKLRDSIKFK